MTTQVTNPLWLMILYRFLGQREIHGPQTAPFITKWLNRLGAWWKDDETAWCGTAIAGSFDQFTQETGIKIALPKFWMRALAWADWGVKLTPEQYRPGAVCSKSRTGGGHVFFYVAESLTHVFGVAGNTGDSVKEAWYDKRDIVAVTWPTEVALEPGDHRVIRSMTPGTPAPVKES